LYFRFVIVLGLLHHCDNKICYQQGGYFFSSLTVIGDILLTGLLIFRGKKAKFRGIFRGKFVEKSADFTGKKSKLAEKSAILQDFCGRKVKIRRKIGQFCGILAEKSQISKDFQGQILRKIG